MKQATTWDIKYRRDGRRFSAWTSPGLSLDEFAGRNRCEIVESIEIPVMLAEDGMTLLFNDVEIGAMDIIGDKDIAGYSEQEIKADGDEDEQAV